MKATAIIACVIGILSLTLMHASAEAESEPFGYFNGNNLYTLCSETSRDFKIGVCTGYVAAIVDLFWSKNSIDGLRACVPETVGTSQARDIVKKWINEKPELGHMNASSVVAKIMAEAFSCE